MLRLGMLPEGYAGLVIYERLRRSPITNKPKVATSIDNQNDGLVCKCQALFLWWDCGGDPGPEWDKEDTEMFSTEQRRIAMETSIKYDHSYADTIAELGYPSQAMTRHGITWSRASSGHLRSKTTTAS